MSRIYVVQGPLCGRTFDVAAPAKIGRGEDCSVRLGGRHVSRLHAHLEPRGDALVIRDNGSRNGIFVNGRGVTESVLRPDDQVEIGEHLLVFEPTSDPAKLPPVGLNVIETVTEPFASLDLAERLAALPAVAAALVAMDDEKEIARGLLEALMPSLAPERGFVMLADSGGRLKPGARRTPAGEEALYLSNVLHHDVVKGRKAVIAMDVMRREPKAGQRVGILAAPLAAKSSTAGLVYLESKLPEGDARPAFKLADLRFAAALAVFAGTRIAQVRCAGRPRLGERPLGEIVATFEKECVVSALHKAKGELAEAARLLGLSRAALDAKLKAPDLDASAPPPLEWKSVQV
jgi:pSer/pThr/pTyr-binding forkhead associated (FHA) protein